MELPLKYLDNLPDYEMSGRVRNPFKHKVLRAQFDACVSTFDKRHKDLMRVDGKHWPGDRYYQSRGNSWACHFWWGYNLTHERSRYKDSFDTPAYACWRAGRAIREQLELYAHFSDLKPLTPVNCPRSIVRCPRSTDIQPNS